VLNKSLLLANENIENLLDYFSMVVEIEIKYKITIVIIQIK
jgi:hypothetical protein